MAAKKGDPDVRGGKYSPTPNPNQALDKGKLNSTGPPKGSSYMTGPPSGNLDMIAC